MKQQSYAHKINIDLLVESIEKERKMLYLHATIVTVNPDRDVLLDGAILVQGDKIADIGKSEALLANYTEEEKVDLSGRIIIPGLITTHMHTAQTLLRGEFNPHDFKTALI